MKKTYITLSFILISIFSFSQGYSFGIVHNSDYNFSIVATTDFDAVNTDVSDIGFTLMLPTGSYDITNISQFHGRIWTATEVTALQLSGIGLGDGTRDAFVMNLPPGQTILTHTNGQQIELISFDVSNMPTSGKIEILLNSDVIAIGLGGAANSFYNSNIDSTNTQDYFNGISLGLEDFTFSTLSVEQIVFEDLNIKIYPNPVNEWMYISSNIEFIKLDIYDLLGELVLTKSQTKQINIGHLKSGMYIMKVYTTNGFISKKVVIK